MKNKGIIILVIILVILILAAGGFLFYKYYINKKAIETNTEVVEEEPIIEEEPVIEQKQVQIFKGKDRPIGFMIDNHSGAWPQANLNKAYMIYEIIVEGGETRLFALFKGQDVDKIGPMRSSRHYFLDYALENDAIYVHYGWSPQAESDIKTLKVNNINGINESTSSFWRIKDKSAPHNVLTSTSKILDIAKRNKYSVTSDKKSVLNYSVDEINLDMEESLPASTVAITHSKLQSVKYEYNEETKMYTRYARGKLQKDYATGEPIVTKNIIITCCENYDLADKENKGRQGLRNIGTFDGYYITNGKAIKIKCTKSSRNQQTIYKDLQGNEIIVNDGNTFVNICPTVSSVNLQ